MKKITAKNLKEFLNEYNYLKGKTIDTIKYDITKDKIEILIDNIKLVCTSIKECDIREYYSWEEIDKCYLDKVQFNNMDTYCFATNNDNPSIYIVCDEIKYSIK